MFSDKTVATPFDPRLVIDAWGQTPLREAVAPSLMSTYRLFLRLVWHLVEWRASNIYSATLILVCGSINLGDRGSIAYIVTSCGSKEECIPCCLLHGPFGPIEVFGPGGVFALVMAVVFGGPPQNFFLPGPRALDCVREGVEQITADEWQMGAACVPIRLGNGAADPINFNDQPMEVISSAGRMNAPSELVTHRIQWTALGCICTGRL